VVGARSPPGFVSWGSPPRLTGCGRDGADARARAGGARVGAAGDAEGGGGLLDRHAVQAQLERLVLEGSELFAQRLALLVADARAALDPDATVGAAGREPVGEARGGALLVAQRVACPRARERQRVLDGLTAPHALRDVFDRVVGSVLGGSVVDVAAYEQVAQHAPGQLGVGACELLERRDLRKSGAVGGAGRHGAVQPRARQCPRSRPQAARRRLVRVRQYRRP
jgi:hypothetical protein